MDAYLFTMSIDANHVYKTILPKYLTEYMNLEIFLTVHLKKTIFFFYSVYCSNSN